jgi:hypothetical protein
MVASWEVSCIPDWREPGTLRTALQRALHDGEGRRPIMLDALAVARRRFSAGQRIPV